LEVLYGKWRIFGSLFPQRQGQFALKLCEFGKSDARMATLVKAQCLTQEGKLVGRMA
jgi:hypothetical protein